MQTVFNVLSLLTLLPLLATVIGGFFLYGYARLHQRSALLAGCSWLLYSGYEYLTQLRILCSGECNIRIDLLLIYPLLLSVSAYASYRCYRHSHRNNNHRNHNKHNHHHNR